MQLRVIDPDTMLPVAYPDTFESLIWTVRIIEEGDFEFYTLVREDLIDIFKIGRFLFCDTFYDSKTELASLMIIQTWEITSDAESGTKFKVTGKDLKNILDWRIVWGRVTFPIATKCNEIITTLLNDNLINPKDWTRTYQDGDKGSITQTVLGKDRKIPNFVIMNSEIELPETTGEVQYENESLYEVINELCNNYKFGYSVLYNFKENRFEFRFLEYVDKSYEQINNPPVIFSTQYGNLRNSDYIESSSNEKNVGLVTGEGDEYNAMYAIVGEYSGMQRREVGISGSDISRTEEDGTEYGNNSYINMLIEKGIQELSKFKYTKTFEGTTETTRNFNYPEDYNIGDIVEIINEWNISSKVLIGEVVLSISTDGQTVLPTFVNLDGGEE